MDSIYIWCDCSRLSAGENIFMKNGIVKKILVVLLAVITVVGCGKSDNSISIEYITNDTSDSAASLESEEIADDDHKTEIEELNTNDSSVNNSDEVKVIAENDNNYGSETVHYDCTYLVEENDYYTYKLIDEDLISQYDTLYADAFEDVIDSYEQVKQWINQSYHEQSFSSSNLIYKQSDRSYVIDAGSYYEMDYNYDLNNVGYTYVDLNSDGTFELIFGVLDYGEYTPLPIFERAYALVDGESVKICEGGSRDYYWLGIDGCIYENGSGGASNNGTSRVHFDSTSLKVGEDTDWGNIGFIADEFLGYWEKPVHIVDGPITDIDTLAKLPEYSISVDELMKLTEEWESRRVNISWLKLSDYLNAK